MYLDSQPGASRVVKLTLDPLRCFGYWTRQCTLEPISLALPA